MNRLFVVSFILLTLLPYTLMSQVIDDILLRYQFSAGGKDNHANINTIKMIIEKRNPRSPYSPSIIQEIYIKYPNKFYYKESVDSSSRIRVISEKGARIKYNDENVDIPFEFRKREIDLILNSSMFEKSRLDWTLKKSKIQYIGDDTVRGKKTYVIKYMNEYPSEDCKYYIDQDKYQLVKKRFNYHAPDGYDHECEIFYSEFENIGGFVIPKKREIQYDSILCEIYNLTNIEIDKPINEYIFDNVK